MEISTHPSLNSFFRPLFASSSSPPALNPATTNAREPNGNDTTCCGVTSDPTATGFSLSKTGDDDDDDDDEASYNLAALCLFVIAVMAIGGNVLVCLAVCCKRKLQSMFNYFLVSLALSDMLSGALVMPLSVVRMTTLDLLVVPKLLCVGWYSLDVLLTSSTICHLCMISIDRYLTLTYPLKYGHAKKKKHTFWKIAAVWVISFSIAGPLFILSMLDTYQDTVQYKGCGPETPTFVVSASVASFYLPLLIMTVTYALTVRALQRQLREQRRLTVVHSSRSGTTTTGPESSSIRSRASGKNSESGEERGVQRHNSCLLSHQQQQQQQRSPKYKQRTPLGGGGGGLGGSYGHPCPATASSLSVKDCHSASYHLLSRSVNGQSLKYRPSHHPISTTKGRVTKQLSDSVICGAIAGESTAAEQRLMIGGCGDGGGGGGSLEGSDVGLQDPQDYEVLSLHSNPESPRTEGAGGGGGGGRFRFHRGFSFRRSLSSTGSSRRGATSPEKSRRAVQVLGILFAVFVVCYLPFFAVYLVKGTCLVCQPYISPDTLVALEWLAYSGSMLNPIIYHIFNPDFRRAFQTLLACRGISRRGPGASGSRLRMSEMPLCHFDKV